MKLVFPDINFQEINYSNATGKFSVQVAYFAELLIKYHERIEIKNKKEAIRVFFDMGETSNFADFLESNNIKFTYNKNYTSKHLESYDCTTKDENDLDSRYYSRIEGMY